MNSGSAFKKFVFVFLLLFLPLVVFYASDQKLKENRSSAYRDIGDGGGTLPIKCGSIYCKSNESCRFYPNGPRCVRILKVEVIVSSEWKAKLRFWPNNIGAKRYDVYYKKGCYSGTKDYKNYSKLGQTTNPDYFGTNLDFGKKYSFYVVGIMKDGNNLISNIDNSCPKGGA